MIQSISRDRLSVPISWGVPSELQGWDETHRPNSNIPWKTNGPTYFKYPTWFLWVCFFNRGRWNFPYSWGKKQRRSRTLDGLPRVFVGNIPTLYPVASYIRIDTWAFPALVYLSTCPWSISIRQSQRWSWLWMKQWILPTQNPWQQSLKNQRFPFRISYLVFLDILSDIPDSAMKYPSIMAFHSLVVSNTIKPRRTRSVSEPDTMCMQVILGEQHGYKHVEMNLGGITMVNINIGGGITMEAISISWNLTHSCIIHLWNCTPDRSFRTRETWRVMTSTTWRLKHYINIVENKCK